MAEHLTPRQRETLEHIRAHLADVGQVPTLAELGGRMGVGVVTVKEHVDGLVDAGYLRRHRGRARGLELVRDVIELDAGKGRAFVRYLADLECDVVINTPRGDGDLVPCRETRADPATWCAPCLAREEARVRGWNIDAECPGDE